jgi:transposase
MAAHGIRPVRLDLTPEERATLEGWTRRRSTAQALALRARIVLACAERPDAAHGVLAAELHVHRTTVGLWRRRFAARGLAGLKDDPRAGAPRTVSDADVERAIATTLEQAPPNATHWSTRRLARAVGLSQTTVVRLWRAFGLQPHRSETFKLSTDPLFVEKVRDVVGLYLDPPVRALVLCVDEKPSIQATEGTAPVLPMRPGQPERRTHDYMRHGTTDLFAALDVASGRVIAETHRRHRSAEFRHFLATVDRVTPPELDLHLILDNAATHKTAAVRRWLLKRPRVHLHVTPTSSSWINLVECWFSLLQRRALTRAAFASTDALEAALRGYIAATNAAPRPFVWTKTADEILASVKRYCQPASRSDR